MIARYDPAAAATRRTNSTESQSTGRRRGGAGRGMTTGLRGDGAAAEPSTSPRRRVAARTDPPGRGRAAAPRRRAGGRDGERRFARHHDDSSGMCCCPVVKQGSRVRAIGGSRCMARTCGLRRKENLARVGEPRGHRHTSIGRVGPGDSALTAICRRPAIPDAALRAGGSVADVGCGMGWSSIGIARAYPDATVDGYDVDAPSVEAARRNAREAGGDERGPLLPAAPTEGSALSWRPSSAAARARPRARPGAAGTPPCSSRGGRRSAPGCPRRRWCRRPSRPPDPCR